MIKYDKQIIDLQELPDYKFIKFLRVEILNIQGYAPTFFGRVRYSCNGVEQQEGLPMDLSKGIFIATLRDEQLGEIQREKLEEILQNASVEITKIVREVSKVNYPLSHYDYLDYNESYSTKTLDDTIASVLKNILKDYSYLIYDEEHSKPPELLRFQVTDFQYPRHAEEIFKIADKLSASIGDTYNVGSYGGSSTDGENLDKVWTRFSLRKFDFEEKSSGN